MSGKKRGSGTLPEVFVCKDRIEDSFHAGTVGEDSHGRGSSSYFPESSFNSLGCPSLRPNGRLRYLKEG